MAFFITETDTHKISIRLALSKRKYDIFLVKVIKVSFALVFILM